MKHDFVSLDFGYRTAATVTLPLDLPAQEIADLCPRLTEAFARILGSSGVELRLEGQADHHMRITVVGPRHNQTAEMAEVDEEFRALRAVLTRDQWRALFAYARTLIPSYEELVALTERQNASLDNNVARLLRAGIALTYERWPSLRAARIPHKGTVS